MKMRLTRAGPDIGSGFRRGAILAAASFTFTAAICAVLWHVPADPGIYLGLCRAGGTDAQTSLPAWHLPDGALFLLIAAGVSAARFDASAGWGGTGTWGLRVLVIGVAMTMGCVVAQGLAASPVAHAVGLTLGALTGALYCSAGAGRPRRAVASAANVSNGGECVA